MLVKKLGVVLSTLVPPQAKGRVEKWNAIYQDRFVKEMLLKGISNMVEGNNLLEDSFLHDLNSKFAVKATNPFDYHRPVQSEVSLLRVLSIRGWRKVSNDWVVQWDNKRFQILQQENLPYAKSRVEIRKYLDDSIHIFYKDHELKICEIQAKHNEDRWCNDFNWFKEQKYQEMKVLQSEGVSYANIAEKVGMSVETVKKYLNIGGVPKPKKRRKRTRITTPYRKFIQKWLEEKNMKATEIHQRLLTLGYRGSIRTTQSEVKEIKQKLGLKIIKGKDTIL